MARYLRRAGFEVDRWRARRPIAKEGLTPIYQRPRVSDPHPQNRVYPYLLRTLVIERSCARPISGSGNQIMGSMPPMI